jgi:deoxyribose-phosphate aldolase
MNAHPKNSREIAALIDHTLLKPEATRNDNDRICQEALKYQFAAVCVNPAFVAQVSAALRDSAVKTCSVVGFPLGANRPSTKIYETRMALDEGAQEIDMVIHIGALKARDDAVVKDEIKSLAAASHQRGAILKVIIEASLLSEEEKARACSIARDANADFVKTATGFSTGGAAIADVLLMRRVVGSELGVKASGGIRTLDDLLKMVESGASRIGSSNGVKIMQEAQGKFGG